METNGMIRFKSIFLYEIDEWKECGARFIPLVLVSDSFETRNWELNGEGERNGEREGGRREEISKTNGWKA